jgi:RNA polymerase sigma-70 factor (ECF subfamily)
MEPQAETERLTRIQTVQELMQEAQGSGGPALASRQRLVMVYHGAAFRYLVGVLHDRDAAGEIAQEFALRFMRGDYLRADPTRGRFRDYLKAVLRNMAMDYWRKVGRDKCKGPLPEEGAALAAPEEAADGGLTAALREELLARTWEALARFEKQNNVPYHTVLSFKVNPKAATSDRRASTAQLAKQLAPRLGKELNENAVRQLLHRAREKFAELLVEEVLRSMLHAEPERLEEELIELKLLNYCRSALERRACHA